MNDRRSCQPAALLITPKPSLMQSFDILRASTISTDKADGRAP